MHRLILVILLNLLPMSSVSMTVRDYQALAYHWAPVVFQDTNEILGHGRYDYITSWRFDDAIDLNGPLGRPDLSNNWENAATEPLPAHVYYSVIETEGHFYLGYFFYHPRDWGDLGKDDDPKSFFQHQHDLEGITMVVEKNGSEFGQFVLMYTQAHDDTYYFFLDPELSVAPISIEGCLHPAHFPNLPAQQYSRDHRDHLLGNLRCSNFAEETTGLLLHEDPLGNERASVFIESEGHGVGQFRRAMDTGGTRYGFTNVDASIRFDFHGDDGVVYYPSVTNTAFEPVTPNTYVPYALVPFDGTGDDAATDGIWRYRNDVGSEEFFEDQIPVTTTRGVDLGQKGLTIRADTSWLLPDGGAHSPWGWPEHSYCGDPGVCSEEGVTLDSVGDWLLDPAAFISHHVTGLDFDPLTERYIFNPYLLGDNSLVIENIPDGLENSLVTVTWSAEEPADATGLDNSLVLYLVPEQEPEMQLVVTTVAAGSFSWYFHQPAGDYRIRAETHSDAGPWLALRVESNEFTIGEPNLDDGLVAYYPFNGNAEDESQNDNHGIPIGALLAEDRYGQSDRAFAFDGTARYIDCGDALNDLQLPYTFTAWIKPEPVYGRVFSSDSPDYNTGNYHGFWVTLLPTGSIHMSYGDGTGRSPSDRRSIFSENVVPFGVWSHVTMVVRGARDMEVYHDGERVGGSYSGSGGNMVHNSYKMLIAANMQSAEAYKYFTGSIDDIRIYDRALGGEEIAALYGMEASSVGDDLTTGRPVLRVHQNQPNPFNPRTRIAFDLPDRMVVHLRVYDLGGRLVDVLVDGLEVQPGRHEVVWNGRDQSGRQLPSGTYFYRLEAGRHTETRRMTLLK